ncbi:hypothetical protein ABZ626_35120 [Streptomyces longispororuber]|uniref:hypothetical protein n=1 Tax=Streptomyces longispororuber TaxID=68230 RepID=UPI00340DE96C
MNELLARLDQSAGWCGVFWSRDPDGMRACLDGAEVPPWDVVQALLHDLAADAGAGVAEAETGRARALHAASVAAHDDRPGGRELLSDRLDMMLQEQRFAQEREQELARSLAVAATPEEVDRIRLDMAWVRDDHERAAARCGELRERMERLDRARAPRWVDFGAPATTPELPAAAGETPAGGTPSAELLADGTPPDGFRAGAHTGAHDSAYAGAYGRTYAPAHDPDADGANDGQGDGDAGAYGGGGTDAGVFGADADGDMFGTGRGPDPDAFGTAPDIRGADAAATGPDVDAFARGGGSYRPDGADGARPVGYGGGEGAYGPDGAGPEGYGGEDAYGPDGAQPDRYGGGEGARPEAYGGDAAGPGSYGTGGARPAPYDLDDTRPEPYGPGGAQPALSGPDGAQPAPSGPGGAQPSLSGPGGAQPAPSAPDAARPDPDAPNTPNAYGTGTPSTQQADNPDGPAPGDAAAYAPFGDEPAHSHPQVPEPRPSPWQDAAEEPGRSPAPGAAPASPGVPARVREQPTRSRLGIRRRPRGARYAGLDGGDGPGPVAVPETDGPAERVPRGARYVQAVDEPPRPAPAGGADDERATAEAVQALIRLRGEGRSGEAHGVLVEAAGWPAARLPLFAEELHHAGLAADWATLLWEAASLPPDRLVAVADALAGAGRAEDCRKLLRQGVARPAPEIAESLLALLDAGRAREARALLDAYVRVRTAEDVAACAHTDAQRLLPLLLETAKAVSDEHHWDLVHALRVAGLAT